MSIPHISCLRLGKPYRSYNESEVKDYRDGSVKATFKPSKRRDHTSRSKGNQ